MAKIFLFERIAMDDPEYDDDDDDDDDVSTASDSTRDGLWIHEIQAMLVVWS